MGLIDEVGCYVFLSLVISVIVVVDFCCFGERMIVCGVWDLNSVVYVELIVIVNEGIVSCNDKEFVYDLVRGEIGWISEGVG